MSRILSTKTVLGGKPRISGTRISVDLIYNYVKDDSLDLIKRDYPHLTKQQIKAALDYLDKRVHKAKDTLEPASA